MTESDAVRPESEQMDKEDKEDLEVEQLLEQSAKSAQKQQDLDEFKTFDEMSIDLKLEKLQNLVKQSQVFSNIIAETLLENTLNKKKGAEQAEQPQPQEAKQPPPKKARKNITDFFKRSGKKEQPEGDDSFKRSGKKEQPEEAANDSFKQPKLVTGTVMRDYQLEGTEWLVTLYENGLNGILADEMGLGKTIQSIALLAFLYEHGIKGPFIIAAPLSTVGNWVSEFKKFTPDLPILGYVGNKEERLKLRNQFFNDNNLIIITSYQMVLNDFKYLSKINWKFLIVDEGHRLKNINCKLIRELKRLKTSNRLLLTGTPLQNNLNELWSLLNFILPDIFHDLELFQKWFDFSSLNSLSNSVTDDQTKSLIDSKIQENLINNLHTILKPFLLRRLKSLVIKNLPPKREYIIYGTLTDEQNELYRSALHKELKPSVLMFALLEHLEANNITIPKSTLNLFIKKYILNEIEETDETEIEEVKVRRLRSEDVSTKSVRKRRLTNYETELIQIFNDIKKQLNNKSMDNLVMQLRLICNSPYLFYFPWEDSSKVSLSKLLNNSTKFQFLNQLVPKLILRGSKVLIFSQFVKMLDLIEDWCELNNYESVRIDGASDQIDREDSISRFNKDDKIKIFLLSTRAGGLGINLTKSDSVIIFDSDWNPQVDLQAMDRVHRIGQVNPVKIYRFVMINSIEEIILSKADSKRILEKLVIKLGNFEHLERLIKKNDLFSNTSSAVSNKQNTNLAKELEMLISNKNFDTKELKIDSNELSDDEVNELVDRSEASFKVSNEDFKKKNFTHIQLFETSNGGI